MNFETFDTGWSRTSGRGTSAIKLYLSQISIAAKDFQILDELLAQQNVPTLFRFKEVLH